MQSREEKIMAAFLSEKFREESLEWDENVMKILLPHLQIEEVGDVGYRSIHMDMDSENKVTATSIKLLNLSRINLFDLLKFVSGEVIIIGGLLLNQLTVFKAITSLFALILSFYPNLTYKFREQDSRVIYAISRLGLNKGDIFTSEQLLAKYKDSNKEPISPEGLERTIQLLLDVKVIEPAAENGYKIRESIKNLNRV